METTTKGDVIELFAGVGGFRLGLAASGWRTILSNQWEPATKAQHASSVYVAKFKHGVHLTANIEDVLAGAGLKPYRWSPRPRKEVHDASGTVFDLLSNEPKEFTLPANVDMVVGGFPCQDYSVAKSLSSSKGLEGKKGVLWWQIMRLVQSQRPKILFLENVDRLLKSPASQRGRDFAIMLRALSDEGYFVEWRVVNAADYGFAQRRRRVFIVAKNLEFFGHAAENAMKDISAFISASGTLARALPVERVTQEQFSEPFHLSNLEELTLEFGKARKTSQFLNAGIMHREVVYTAKVVPLNREEQIRMGHTFWNLENVMEAATEDPTGFEIPKSEWPKWEGYKFGGPQDRTHSSGFTYTYSEGKMKFPDDKSIPARTILTAEGGTSPSRFKHAVEFAKNRYRRLMPVELELLNDFPPGWTEVDSFGNKVSDVRRAFFMGNALVVGIVERIGRELALDLKPPTISEVNR